MTDPTPLTLRQVMRRYDVPEDAVREAVAEVLAAEATRMVHELPDADLGVLLDTLFRDGRPVSVEVTATLRIARSDDDRAPRVLRLVTE